MSSAFAAPFIVRADQSSIGLERVALSGANSASAYSEDWLQELLYRHGQALPVAEIDDPSRDSFPCVGRWRPRWVRSTSCTSRGRGGR